MEKLAALLVIIMVTIQLTLGLSVIGFSIYGLILAFQASLLVGVIALIVEPSPLIIGLVCFFTGTNLAQQLASWLGV